LTHYWPICDSEMNDHIASAHMTQGNLTMLALDRFGNANSALSLNGGWTQVPAGIYFDTPEFTISVWIYPQQVGSWARLIDFGNGPNIVFALNDGNNNQFPIVAIENVQLVSSKSLKSNEWQHLASTFDGYTLSIYINGTLAANQTFTSFIPMSKLNRTLNYVGKMNWAGDIYSYSYIDELRFYNKSLTQSQILELMLTNDKKNITACSSTPTSTTSTTTTSTTTISTTSTSTTSTTTSSG
jgi:hypothetical protein